jgi:hypothetical protein
MLRPRAAMTTLLLAALAFTGCAKTTESQESREEPATVEAIAGTDLNRLTLTESAVERLGIETAPVEKATGPAAGGSQRAVAYSAVIYDADGRAAVYTNPEPRVYVRAPVSVDDIQGDIAFITDGPPVGTAIVTVGAAELFGVDAGVGGNE